jgi:predicted ATPase
MDDVHRIIITGGPGTGKSSIIHQLEKSGYPVFPEYSRTLIREQLETGGNILPWDDLPAFSEKVIAGRLVQWHEGAKKQLSFYDRSIIDSLAYLHKDGLQIPDNWMNLAQNYRYYNEVFITPPWLDIYQLDEERRESFDQLKEIHKSLLHSYRIFGYKLIEVPCKAIEERMAFILNEIK